MANRTAALVPAAVLLPGSYRYSAKVPGITELEAGGGCLMDLMYRDDCHVGPETGLEFALTLHFTLHGLTLLLFDRVRQKILILLPIDR